MICHIYWIIYTQSARIGLMPRPRGGDWLEDEIKSLVSQRVDVVVSLLSAEEVEELDLAPEHTLCQANGIEFFSFPINDRSVPPLSIELSNFVRSLQDRFAQGKSIVIHCRAGIGRSSIIAACVMVLTGHPVDMVLPVIARSRGVPVPDTKEQSDWVQKFAKWYGEDGQ